MAKSSVALSVKDVPIVGKVVGKIPGGQMPKPAPKKTAKVVKGKVEAKVDGNEWAEKYRVGTIGRDIAEAILAGKLSNEEILADIKKSHTAAKTTYGCIAWYRSAARKAGVIK